MKKILGLLLCVILLTGCMDYKVGLTIKEDKSADIKISMAINLLDVSDDLINTMLEASLEESCSSDCNNDATCMETCKSELREQVGTITKDGLKELLDQYATEDTFNDDFLSDEDVQKLKDLGYEVKIDTDKENYSYKVDISKHVNNIDELVTDKEEVNIEDVLAGEDDNLFIKNGDNKYKVNMKIDMSSMNTEDIEEYNIELSDIMTFYYEVTLP